MDAKDAMNKLSEMMDEQEDKAVRATVDHMAVGFARDAAVGATSGLGLLAWHRRGTPRLIRSLVCLGAAAGVYYGCVMKEKEYRRDMLVNVAMLAGYRAADKYVALIADEPEKVTEFCTNVTEVFREVLREEDARRNK